MTLDEHLSHAREYGRRLRAANALDTFVLVTFEHDDGSYETLHCRDATFLRFAAERGVPSDRLRQFRIAFLEGRPSDALVYAMIDCNGQLGARTFPISAPN